MADLGMAMAVLNHAETYSDRNGWHTVCDFWTAEDILAELQSAEAATGRPIAFDAAAIAYFTTIANPSGARIRH